MNLDDVLTALEAINERRTFERWRYFLPIPKQQEFMAAGANFPERMLMANNGGGKTETAAYEVSRHLTGTYPPWWTGHKITKPVTWWVGSISGTQSRDGAQTKLFGQPGDPEAFGTGFIPREAFARQPTAGRSAPNAIDSALIKCRINGRNDESARSRVVFKTYEQGRETWQGADIDGLWNDEEPSAEILSEGLARLRGKGLFLMTFTPLKGMTEVVKRFKYEDNPLRHVTYLRLADCSWYTDAQKQRQVEQYPVHEREARINGQPMLGEGAVFSTPIENLLEPPISADKVPDHWPLLWSLDFGIDHPFAAVLQAWDRDEDRIHLLTGFRMKGAIPLQHADAMKRIAVNVPVAWPHDGNNRDKGSGEPLAAIYRKHGLLMLPEHATFEDGGYSFEAGIALLEDRMTRNKFKVSNVLTEWQVEYGSYHREKGLVVKKDDDLLSATRIGAMMIRKARRVPLGSRSVKPLRPTERGIINPWTGRVDNPAQVNHQGGLYGSHRHF